MVSLVNGAGVISHMNTRWYHLLNTDLFSNELILNSNVKSKISALVPLLDNFEISAVSNYFEVSRTFINNELNVDYLFNGVSSLSDLLAPVFLNSVKHEKNFNRFLNDYLLRIYVSKANKNNSQFFKNLYLPKNIEDKLDFYLYKFHDTKKSTNQSTYPEYNSIFKRFSNTVKDFLIFIKDFIIDEKFHANQLFRGFTGLIIRKANLAEKTYLNDGNFFLNLIKFESNFSLNFNSDINSYYLKQESLKFKKKCLSLKKNFNLLSQISDIHKTPI